MSKFLLLLNPNECPTCHHAVPAHLPCRCRLCGKWLFLAGHNFRQFEEDTGWREYWVYTGTAEGWKHRSHLFDRAAQALPREYSAPKLPANYGTPEFVEDQKKSARKLQPHE